MMLIKIDKLLATSQAAFRNWDLLVSARVLPNIKICKFWFYRSQGCIFSRDIEKRLD